MSVLIYQTTSGKAARKRPSATAKATLEEINLH